MGSKLPSNDLRVLWIRDRALEALSAPLATNKLGPGQLSIALWDATLLEEGSDAPGRVDPWGHHVPDGAKYCLHQFLEGPLDERHGMLNLEESSTLFIYVDSHGGPEGVDDTMHSTPDPNGQDVETYSRALSQKIEMKSKATCKMHLGSVPRIDSDIKYVYFLRTGRVPYTSDNEQASILMLNGVEFGTMSGDLLACLAGTIKSIYIPMLDPQLNDEEGSADGASTSRTPLSSARSLDPDAPKVTDTVRAEFKSSLHKFASQVGEAIQQVKGEVHLRVPNMIIDQPEAATANVELVNELEQCLEDWCKAIATVVEQEIRKTPQGKGPLAEIEFWRGRNAILGTLYEQINTNAVRQILRVLELVDATMLPSFNSHFSELSKLCVEAKDNVKFLTTLERHFKNLSTGTFSLIIDTLPSMMNAIRMVWIISRHYNTDERMVPLMERVAWEIADKVASEINIRTILKRPPQMALHTICEAKAVLEMWFSSYMKVREKIEQSGTDHRWEFDRKQLFEQTNYMAKICDNLQEVTTVLEQFLKFLGPELKAVTGSPQGIDEVLSRVESLTVPIESVPFDIFDRRFKSSWDAVMMQFRENVIEIEVLTRRFIDTSFQKLRSAEGAFDLLQNFRTIQSRESINRQMMEKYRDILMQYTKELERIENLFFSQRDKPPTYRNYPPTTGAIAWAKSLYLRAKRPIVRFRTMSELLTSDLGEGVKQRYLTFARLTDAYIQDLYLQWRTHAQIVATNGLKTCILATVEGATSAGENMAVEISPPPYFPNFSPDLLLLIREAKGLDRLGFEIPEVPMNVTLQEDKFHHCVQELDQMLHYHDRLVSQLTAVESHLLVKQLVDLRNTMKPGLTTLNWNSQRIPSYIESCNKALNEFAGVVSQIHKSSTMIEEVVQSIETAVLVKESDFPHGIILDVSEFYEKVEKSRLQLLEPLVRKYKSIGPLLIKVEEIVVGSNTGSSIRLHSYYSYWERRIFNAITRMVLTTMASFQCILNISTEEKFRDGQLKCSPVCRIRATMNGKDIVVSPTLSDVYKLLSKLVKHIVESSKLFLRWMRGTCRETDAQRSMDDEEPILFSFYNDISQNSHVIKIMLSLNQAIHKVFNTVNKYLDGWRRYDNVYHLWNQKRRSALDKLLDTYQSCVFFDTRLASYQKLAEMIRAQPTDKDIDFLRVDCFSVAIAIAGQAQSWKDSYGHILHQTAQRSLGHMDEKMKYFEHNLEADPKHLDTLKFVLNLIGTILEDNNDMELSNADIEERYRTLKVYGVVVPDEEWRKVEEAQRRWQKLVISAKTKDLRLVKVKSTFREVTKQQALEFSQHCQSTRSKFVLEGPGSPGMELTTGLALLKEYKTSLALLHARRQELVNAENLFNLVITSYPELQEISEEVEKLEMIYSLFTEQKDFKETMSTTLWLDLDINQLTKNSEELERKCRKFPKELKILPAYQAVELLITSLKESIPLLQSLKNDAIKSRHWQSLMEATHVTTEMNFKTFTVENLFAMELHRHGDKVAEIVNSAQQELKIELEIKKIHDCWTATSFEIAKYRKNGEDRGWVLRSADEVRSTLEDHMLNLQTMAGSRFVGSFADDIRAWERKLNLVSECMDIWFLVQRKWMYLESIFAGAEDIRLQLPEEARKFDAIDKTWRAIMISTHKNPNVVEACHADNRIETMKSLSERLDKCQKSLSDYLDTKRSSFPRFFFISDDELLSVLGSSDPSSIQQHLLKLFDNVKVLFFGKNGRAVEGMESSEGESFSLKTPTAIEGAVESWMTSVEEEMKSSLHVIAKEGVFKYAGMERTDWVSQVLGMVGLVGSQIWWTWEVEDAFRSVAGGLKSAMKDLERKQTAQLNSLVAMVRRNIDKQSRRKVNTLLIIDVHARDIVDSFVRDSILTFKEFAWESQLRFYWNRDLDDIIIAQCTGNFRYGYEYMGLNGRLVITPLTDRCYMTLTQALTFKLGGSPAGPAGTGKTETVKDLAKSLALPCFVINCGEGLDYKAMGSIFSGLVQVGAWGCFDEFNRINIEVLSVVSAQLKAIQNALNYDRQSCDIGMGTEIKIKKNSGFASCGFFITMNPGYAGRTELPDNLKALFRPVTMIVPDLLQICQIMLFSEGFENAVILATKMTVLYKLAREQLSKQYHYDFGLRALKSVLVMAGSLKRQYSSLSEDVVLMRALRDSNMPKFVFDDVPLFKGLITDLFPGLDCPRVGYAELKVAIENDLEKNGFKSTDSDVFGYQVDKVIQMYETMIVRHTTMIVGPTGGGKSLILDTLARASLAAMSIQVKQYTLNPKAQSVAELYGTMDPVTRDWTDGVLSKLFRETNQPLPLGKETEKRWIVFDGDVDAVWVENMNSVMDDNKLLTLPNGERMRLQAHCSLVCETFDLQYASPATISRCGMVWVDPKNLGYKPFFEKWLRERSTSAAKDLERQAYADLFESMFVRSLLFAVDGVLDGKDVVSSERLVQVIPVVAISLCKQLCCMLEAVTPQDTSMLNRGDFEALFMFSLLWSIGASLVASSRQRFDAFLKKSYSGSLPDGFIYDYFYDLETRRWLPWQVKVPDYVEPSPFRFHRVFVPTTDSVLYTFLLEKLVMGDKAVLLVGESGTAKTVTVNNFLGSLNQENFAILNMNFSSRTASIDVQSNIEANVDKRTGRIFGPPSGKKLIVFIDDLNMPRVDTYGTQQPLALLHFLLNRGLMYDRGKDLDLRILKDLRYIGSMGPPGGGRNPVDPRFIALFSVFCMAPPTAPVLTKIYTSIMTTYLRDFPQDVQALGAKIPKTLLKLYLAIVDNLPPTPSKFHYIFNLRDLGRVCEGLCLATPDKIDSPTKLLKLYRNEILRVYSDRLILEEDIRVVENDITAIFSEEFPAQPLVLSDQCIFGDFEFCVGRLTSGAEDPRLYHDLESYDHVRKIFDEVLEAYNVENRPMTLVLFDVALEHLTRIHRIIRMPRGNALLVGVGGSGKQSLTKLATFCAGYHLFEITLSRGYGENEFREEMKELYKKLAHQPVVFLFTDAHVVQEGFLEFVNNMLTTGMIPALHEQDEKDGLISTVRSEVKAAGLFDSQECCWAYYINKCRDNLHIVLAMSPSGGNLRVRCRNFPGLVNNTVIDWFFPWPEEALKKVASTFLAEEALPDQYRQSITSHFVFSHLSVVQYARKFEMELRRHFYVTPKNYLDFIHNYRIQLKQNYRKIDTSTKRLAGGLAKLVEAAKAVDKMQAELTEKKIVVDQKTENCEKLIQVISEKSAVAQSQQNEAMRKQTQCEEKAKIIAIEKQKADDALNEALPAVEAAADALNALNKADLTEIKAFTSPPPLVKATCLCVLGLNPTNQNLDEDWKGAKTMLSNANLLSLLKNYDKDSITEKMIRKVKAYFKNPDLNIDNMRTISTAGAGLLAWVIAIVKYYDVAKNVEPLRLQVKTMEKEQMVMEEELGDLREQLATLQQELNRLSSAYNEANEELQGLKLQAAKMEKRLNAASKLIAGLASERQRWSADIEEFHAQKDRLVGDCLLAASFLSYTGAFSYDYRKELIHNCFQRDIEGKGIPLTTPFDLPTLLTTDAVVQRWVSEGLPADEHSVLNGILTTCATRFPLCIDPQQQAVSWIKVKESRSNLMIKSLNDADFVKHLELAIQFGNPFLFEAIDEDIDPILDPVLEKSLIVQGSQKLVKLGDKMVEWDDGFRLYFTTKLANPHYSPEIMGKIMIINYSVTRDGLTNQLLNVVVAHERPDLEEQYKVLVDQMAASTSMIVELEDNLLSNLSNSTGNILDNEELLVTLDETKTKAVEIGAKLEQSKFTSDEINKARAVYTLVARRGSILYFAVSGLSIIMTMYEISLSSFLNVFRSALIAAKKDVVLENRLKYMLQSVTERLYDFTCTGIFERHKLMFAVQMTCSIMDGDGSLDRAELEFFLKGDTSLNSQTFVKPSSLQWLSDSGWKDLTCLKTVSESLTSILEEVVDHSGAWKSWYDSECPELGEIPVTKQLTLSPMQKLLICRCFRPDRVYNAAKLFVISIMGEKYVQPPVLNYSRIYLQSTPTTPMVFILSPGADPQSDIQMLGEEHGFTGHKFKFLALGQGQGPLAEQMLTTGVSRGHWVLLQNCHLLSSWLKTLEKFVEAIQKPHPDFRLWLTTEPVDKFPLGILQRSLKVVTEPPDGLKQNMRSSYSKIDQVLLEECPHWAYRPLLYVLCFLHAVVLERRKYGKIGWNVSYDFNESDFTISRRLLCLYLAKAYSDGDETLPWGSLRYLIGDAMYGGRVSDNWDRRILATYLQEYMGDFLFDKCQKFYFSRDEFDYELPEWGSLESYTAMVEKLPLNNSPAVFGLHPNAEIGYFTDATKRMWRDLINLQPRTSAAGEGLSREAFICKVAHDIQTKVPALIDIRAVRKGFISFPTPTEIVLLQDLERWNILTDKMCNSLADLQKALRGEIGMSEELDQLGEALYNGFLPAMWRRLCPATQKSLGAWMQHFQRRYKLYSDWIESGEQKIMWLSGLHIPESYLTALVQTACRMRNWPLDKSTLYTTVTPYIHKDEIVSKPVMGCYVEGLYLEGASWSVEKSCLVRQHPKILVENLPILQIIPVETSKLKLQNTFRTPVYVTQERANAMGVGLVFQADLTTYEHSSHWILQGVALVLNVDSS